MPTVSQTIKFRQQRRTRELHHPWSRLGLVSGLLISLMVVIAGLAGAWLYGDITRDLPSIDSLPALLEPPDGILLQPTRLYDRTGEHVILTLENPAAQSKQYLQVGQAGSSGARQVSQYLVDATIATYEPGFWESQGYTLKGISETTHPTIAQLLVSNLVLDSEPPSVRRNIRERLLAAQLVAKWGREKILEWYLNCASYGELIYGADAAARVYFGKSATNLTLAEAAMLTAIAQSQTNYPMIGSQILKQHQEQIIQEMQVDGFISAKDAEGALKEKLLFQAQAIPHSIAPAFTNLVLRQLGSELSLERIYRGGVEVITTLDYDLQQQAACATLSRLAQIQGTQAQDIIETGSPCEVTQLLPPIQTTTEKPSTDVNANVVVLDTGTSQILALVEDDKNGLIPTYPATHTAGTILSPFLYLTAFAHGWSPASLLWDIPTTNGENSPQIRPGDETPGTDESYHGPVRLRTAMINDYYGAATSVLEQVGTENVILTEKQFGINAIRVSPAIGSTLDDLYNQQTSLLKSVQAYAVLANQGVMIGQPSNEGDTKTDQIELSPTTILSMSSTDGHVWLEGTKPQAISVVSPQLAYLISNVLSEEKERSQTPGQPDLLGIGRPAAAKIGLTSDANGAWVIGFTPQVVIGTWIGHSGRESGGITAEMSAGLWHALMQYATSQMPVQDFAVPEGISSVQVCDPSGLLVTPLCPVIVQEVFLKGNEPNQVDNLYQKFIINRETGLLATIFTPVNLQEEKVYMVVPPQSVAWAKEAGQALPPDTYDEIYAPPQVSTDVRLTNPKMFGYLSGQVNFTGSTMGDGFAYYRIQVGQGLNPQQWLQIGEDIKQPVDNGNLGIWDTSGLEGVYIIELHVVRTDQRIDRAFLEVTVDNIAPQVQIVSPSENEQIALQREKPVIMQVSANDNIVVGSVKFYIDDSLVATLSEPPYIILWHAEPGKHTLQIKAYDLAGNHNQATVSFTVTQ